MADEKALSPGDWATIVTLASRGEKNARDLADMFQVTVQAIHQGLRKRGVSFGSRVTEVSKEVEDEASAARKKRVQDGQKKAEDYSKRLDLVVQLTVKKIVDANATGTLAAVNGDIITLKNAIATISKGRQEHWDIHKIDELLQENEELAELNVGEYTEEELEAIKEANEAAYQESLDNDSDLNVSVDDEEDDQGD